MSRHLFHSAVLLLLVALCGTSGAAHAEGTVAGNVQMPQWVTLFLPGKTPVVPRDGSASKMRDWFFLPSIVSAGGVMVTLAEGQIELQSSDDAACKTNSSDIVAGYIHSAEPWSSLVGEVNNGEWKAYTVFSRDKEGRPGLVAFPAAIARGNNVFLLVGSYELTYEAAKKHWALANWEAYVVVGEAKRSARNRSELINWGKPIPLSEQISLATHKSDLKDFFGSGHSGVLMEDGTLVFSLMATSRNDEIFSMILYSSNNGNKWMLSAGTAPAKCIYPRITEWEKGKLLMVAQCGNGQNVYESRDMGGKWTEAVGTLPGVWFKSRPRAPWDKSLRVGDLITATIEGKKLMLYTRQGHPFWGTEAKALYLWVTDNSRTFHLGPLSTDHAVDETLENALLYSDGALHLSRESIVGTRRGISLARLTEELKTIKSTLSTWARLDAFFSKSSIPTAGLVGFLSDTSSGGDTWIDEYRCVNATVTKAAKVKNGFKFTAPGSRAMWSMSRWGPNKQYGFVNHRFTLVATVTIHQVPKGSTPLLGAGLGDGAGKKIIGLSYGMNKKWEKVFNGTKTAPGSTWEPGREYQVALMLQDGNKGSVYVDGVIVGSPETIPTLETQGFEIPQFYVGSDEGGSGSDVTVTNVFLYDRPLSVDELKLVRKSDAKKGKGDGSMRGGVSRVLLLLLLLLGLCGFSALYGA
ncbi:putative trans-sialidase, Group II [Trypanosoma cruzi]|uniref:Putative trans-sialidase, Group II n=1 Tax=Trypanosoma cruzi TaxID=5693 RepID=A0A2V2VSZ5_TRYCR|nr:putative trans-sialidase, Group II [Trypanosoma cruzi]